MDWWVNFALAFPLSSACVAASWHFLERSAVLKRRPRLLRWQGGAN